MNLNQLETPALILDLDKFEHNMKTMSGLLKGTKMRLRPHYKSNKCPTIAHLQLDAGAKGITCAKLSEAEDLVHSGVEDILIANQIVDTAKIARLAVLAKCSHMTVCVDALKNIEDLQQAAQLQNSMIHCLVEYDIGMNRCGVRTMEECEKLVRAIKCCPNLCFDGIQAYAGNLAHEENLELRRHRSNEVEERLRQLKTYLEQHGHTVKEISGTSTGTVELRCRDSVYTEVQAGSYIFMDMAYRAVGVGFENALFVLATVISRRPGVVITDVGLKSVSVDQRPPAFAGYEQYPVEMSEEHSAVYADIPVKCGDRLVMIPSHCCTTVNLHNWIYFVRNDTVVDRVAVTSRGKSR